MTTCSEIKITPAAAEHEEGWRVQWAIYHGGAVTDEITDATWMRILNPASSINSLIAMRNSEVVGFVTFVVHEGTWEIAPLCYVEDLYIEKQSRGDALGIGKAFANVLMARLETGEWSRLYGITRSDNIVAQRLYRQLTNGEPYLRYVVHRKKVGLL